MSQTKQLNNIQNKNYFAFNISFVIRMIGIGSFNTIFNMYVMGAGFSSGFLGLFLAVGNLSMAIMSYPVGILSDKFDKKKLLIFFTFIGAICFIIQATIKHETLLLMISAIYGFGFIGLCTIIPPYLKEYDDVLNRKNLIVVNRAVNIIATTVGAILCGVLSGGLFGFSAQKILVVSALLYFLSIVPLYSLKSEFCKKEKKQINFNCKEKETITYLTFLVIGIFFFLGVAPLITNYINLYFKNKFILDISKISYVYATINLCTGIFIMFISQIKITLDTNFKKPIYASLLCIVFINVLLIAVNILIIQVIGVVILLTLFEFLFSTIYDFVLSYTPNKIHGKMSGIIQMSSNLSETIGIYLCGAFLTNYKFLEIHIISIIFTLLVGLSLLIFFYYVKVKGEKYSD